MSTITRGEPTLLSKAAGFFLHTIAVYICALYVSPWLVGRWFAWVLPLMRIRPNRSSGDWYLSHLEIVTLIAALIFGFIGSIRFKAAAKWAWTVPTAILVYRLVTYRSSSVLAGTPALSYFFDIQKTMPTLADPFAGDARRVLAQAVVTAPFYAGIAYTLGARASKLTLAQATISSMIDWRSHDNDHPEYMDEQSQEDSSHTSAVT